MMQLISFVIPCYHSEKTIATVVEEIERVVKEDGRYRFEVVLVNDNPPDETWRTILDLSKRHPYVRGFCMTHNFGQHAALMAGYRNSKGDIVVSLDDDGQTPPDQAFKLIDALEGNVDLVYASYPENAYASGFRKLGSQVNDLMAQSLIGKPKDVYLSSYLAATRAVIDRVVEYQGPYPYVDGLMLKCCSEVKPVPVRHDDRASGSSGYSLKKLLALWLNGFTSFSVKPLHVSTFLGFSFAGIGLLLAIILVVRKIILQDDIDAGWSSIMCTIIIVGGIIMMMVGMVGEYVGRLYMTVNNMPQYYIRESSQPDGQKSSTHEEGPCRAADDTV